MFNIPLGEAIVFGIDKFIVPDGLTSPVVNRFMLSFVVIAGNPATEPIPAKSLWFKYRFIIPLAFCLIGESIKSLILLFIAVVLCCAKRLSVAVGFVPSVYSSLLLFIVPIPTLGMANIIVPLGVPLPGGPNMNRSLVYLGMAERQLLLKCINLSLFLLV